MVIDKIYFIAFPVKTGVVRELRRSYITSPKIITVEPLPLTRRALKIQNIYDDKPYQVGWACIGLMKGYIIAQRTIQISPLYKTRELGNDK